jgi:hypothetical protein
VLLGGETTFTELGILIGVAAFAALVREYYGNKGFFILPHNTDKGYSLGSLTAIVMALFAVLINIPVALSGTFTIPMAASLGLSWGIAAPDIVANFLTKRKNNGNNTPS